MILRNLYTILLISICSQANAYKVEPMVSEMSPTGAKSQISMRIDNPSNEPLTVEVFPQSMALDDFGNETLQPSDDILVIPFTSIIQPGRSQSVIVRYLGDPEIAISKAYRVSVKQVKVNSFSEKNKGKLNLVFQFNTLLNVVPDDSYFNLYIESITEKEGMWILKATNSGNKYGKITQTEMNFSDKKKSVTLKGDKIREYIEEPLILPKSTRYLEMKPLEGFDLSTLKVNIRQVNKQ